MIIPSIQQLHNIFYSGQHTFASDTSLLHKIHFLIQENYLFCKQITFVTKSSYLEQANKTQELEQAFEADGGSLEHIALKRIAQNYLLSQGIKSKCEQPFCGYYPDVISDDNKIIIECGHTDNIDKMFVYFTQGEISKFIQLPYPDIDELMLYGYLFTASPDLHTFLEYEASPHHKKIKEIINRPR